MKFKFKIQQYQTDTAECTARIFDDEPCIDNFEQLWNAYNKDPIRKVL